MIKYYHTSYLRQRACFGSQFWGTEFIPGGVQFATWYLPQYDPVGHIVLVGHMVSTPTRGQLVTLYPQEAAREQEVGLGYKTSMPTPSHPVPPERLHLLKVHSLQ